MKVHSLFCHFQLKKAFPKKNLPPTPPKGLLRMKSQELLEEVDNVFINLLVKHECLHMGRKTRMSVAHVSIRDSS